MRGLVRCIFQKDDSAWISDDGFEEVRKKQIIVASFIQPLHPSYLLSTSSPIHYEHRRLQLGVGNMKVRSYGSCLSRDVS